MCARAHAGGCVGPAPGYAVAFAGPRAVRQGSHAAPYQHTQDPSMTTARGRQAGLVAITAMGDYRAKSLEELRHEDYLIAANPHA